MKKNETEFYKQEDIDFLELKDFKDMETAAENMMMQARKDIFIAKMMYANAVKHIKRMNGTTNEQIRQNARNETV